MSELREQNTQSRNVLNLACFHYYTYRIKYSKTLKTKIVYKQCAHCNRIDHSDFLVYQIEQLCEKLHGLTKDWTAKDYDRALKNGEELMGSKAMTKIIVKETELPFEFVKEHVINFLDRTLSD